MPDNRRSMYQRHPELYRYTSSDRYENPKEDFKTIAAALEQRLDTSAPLSVADIGCGNGELLYYLHRRFPQWQLHGYDHTAEFIETAKAFPGLAGVGFEQADLYDIKGKFDVVIATCFLSLFPEFEEPVEKLLSLCRDGGYVMATGLFNPHNIEVRVQFCDNSRPETAGQWNTDFNRHSQRRIRDHFSDAVESIDFQDCTYDIELPHDPAAPIHVWTVKDEQGRTLLINGAWQIANQTLMVIRK
ncbi:MAG: methyltransferase domain-containing protein [Gammaproteobacteria bacterium]